MYLHSNEIIWNHVSLSVEKMFKNIFKLLFRPLSKTLEVNKTICASSVCSKYFTEMYTNKKTFPTDKEPSLVEVAKWGNKDLLI